MRAAAEDGGDGSGAILDRLDAIGRLLAEGPAARPGGPPPHLVNRIDMLAGIVAQVLAERDADEARLAALARRVVALESGLLPALGACVERLDALLPLATGLALGGQAEGAGLALVLRDLRDALARLDRHADGAADGSPVESPADLLATAPKAEPAWAAEADPADGDDAFGPVLARLAAPEA